MSSTKHVIVQLRPDLRVGRRRASPEHATHASIVAFHRFAVDPDDAILLSIPNGGKRPIKTAAAIKAEGAMEGASDLMLVGPGFVEFLEVKVEKSVTTERSYQSKAQKDFEAKVTKFGHVYTVIRSIDDYRAVLERRKVPHRAH